MFKITPMQDKTRQKEICALCGADFRPDYFAYIMFDIESGETLGMSQFEIREGSGYISDLREAPYVTDNEAMFILGRQTMNFIDLCDAHQCYAARDAGDERLMGAIGFKMNGDGEYFADMTGMFDGHCDGHPVKLEN